MNVPVLRPWRVCDVVDVLHSLQVVADLGNQCLQEAINSWCTVAPFPRQHNVRVVVQGIVLSVVDNNWVDHQLLLRKIRGLDLPTGTHRPVHREVHLKGDVTFRQAGLKFMHCLVLRGDAVDMSPEDTHHGQEFADEVILVCRHLGLLLPESLPGSTGEAHPSYACRLSV